MACTEEEVHYNDIGTVILVTIKDCVSGTATVLNVSAASTLELILQSPSGTSTTKTASFNTDGTDGKTSMPISCPRRMVCLASKEYETETVVAFTISPEAPNIVIGKSDIPVQLEFSLSRFKISVLLVCLPDPSLPVVTNNNEDVDGVVMEIGGEVV